MRNPTEVDAAGMSPVRMQARILQIVVGSLMAGVVAFAGFVVFTGHLEKPPQGQILSLVAVGAGALMAVMHVVVPATIERAALANQSVGSGVAAMIGIFVARTIVAVALLEGAAMLSVVALMIEHQAWVLGVTAVMLMLMALQIPSTTRLEHWLEMRIMERDAAS